MSGQTDDLEERPWEQPGCFRLDCEPERGSLLLALGLVSLVCGWLALCLGELLALVGLGFGIAVRRMTGNDLRKMAAGLMDPSGEESTRKARKRAARGMILSALALAIRVVVLLVLLGAS